MVVGRVYRYVSLDVAHEKGGGRALAVDAEVVGRSFAVCPVASVGLLVAGRKIETAR